MGTVHDTSKWKPSGKPRSFVHFVLRSHGIQTLKSQADRQIFTYQRSLVLAHSVHGGQCPCLPSQMWAGILAPLLSGVVGIRLGDGRTGVPPHFALAIIHLLIRVQLLTLSYTISHGVQQLIRFNPLIRPVPVGFAEHLSLLHLSTHFHFKTNEKITATKI